jgi:DNA-binding response OmpR family regulator
MRVLVVEDDQPLVRIMTKSLETNGFEVISAYDGEEGLRAARDEHPEAIVLDLQLPKLNGVDLCRRLRSEGNAVPIIMLTTSPGWTLGPMTTWSSRSRWASWRRGCGRWAGAAARRRG